MSDSWLYVSAGLSLLGFTLLMLGHKARVDANKLKARTVKKEEMLQDSSPEILVKQIDVESELISEKLSVANGHASRLRGALAQSRVKLEQIEAGLMPPTFSHSDSETLKRKIKDTRLRQFEIIKAGQATERFGGLTWFGSKAKGQQMLVAYQRLLLKAFNAEFDAIRKQMRYATKENANTKLDKVNDILMNLGETAGCYISDQYRAYKFQELDIWWKELKLNELEKQARKEQREVLRRQAKIKVADTEDMEDEISYKYSDLKKAREIAKQLAGLDAKQAEEQIAKLQREIGELEEKFARATSQAQITRAGYVYVISNIGCFGEGVLKIGMTRRLEPLDRVRELGDASVPFRFDVHALVFAEDAPSLETSLHNHFSGRRFNKENLRKEFFHVTVEEVSKVMSEKGVEADWYFEAEAREYYESELIRSALENSKAASKKVSESFPAEI